MAYVYTAEEFAQISQMYQNGRSLEDIQSLFPDKSVASIRMKLVKAGIYVAKAAAKAAGPSVTKSVTKAEPRPTSKSGILAAYKLAAGKVGYADF